MNNRQIAELISERIGPRPVPFEAVRTLALEIYHDLGGREDDENFADIFEILLSILPLTNLIDDTSIYLDKTWSSYKIDASLNQVITTLDGKQDVLAAGQNIVITDNAIKSVGYRYDTINGAFAEGDKDIVEGGITWIKSTATGLRSHAEGTGTVASGTASHAEGYRTIAFSEYAHTEGHSTNAIGIYSHAEGFYTKAIGGYSHSEGNKTVASGDGSHAEGYYTNAIGSYSHTEGYLTTASGENSHSEGYYTNAIGGYSHSEGNKTVASGGGSHAEGYLTTASGENSHAEGIYTNAIGRYSHTEGYLTTASGENSHAEGYYTTASSENSHTEGCLTIAQNLAEHAEGVANVSHKASNNNGDAGNTLHSVGIGKDSDRKNAFEIMQNGDIYVYGLGNYNGTLTKTDDPAIMTLQDILKTIADALGLNIGTMF